VDADDVKPRGQFDVANPVTRFGKGEHDPPFADLVEQEERQGDA
jgi:hypothetical protein